MADRPEKKSVHQMSDDIPAETQDPHDASPNDDARSSVRSGDREISDASLKDDTSPDGASRRHEISLVNTAVLAYIGDAVYEQYVRTYVFHKGLLRPDRLHRAAVRYVRAEAQAAAFDALWPELSPDEQAVARRGKNHKITSMPHHVDPIVYKKATGFEALIGYLNLAQEYGREKYIVERTFEIVEASGIPAERRDA